MLESTFRLDVVFYCFTTFSSNRCVWRRCRSTYGHSSIPVAGAIYSRRKKASIWLKLR